LLFKKIVVLSPLVLALSSKFQKWTGKNTDKQQKTGVIMEKYKEIGLSHPIGMTLIIGPNNSHSSTLLAGLRRTVTFVRGFAFLNMDESLNLLKPEDALSGFFQFLRHQHDELKKTNYDAPKAFRHAVVSNLPKTSDQMERLLEFCPGLRLAYINASHGDADEAYNLAMEFREITKTNLFL